MPAIQEQVLPVLQPVSGVQHCRRPIDPPESAALPSVHPPVAGRTIYLYGLALLSAVLLNLCFPIAGPVRAWRTFFAFVGAVPLLIALVCRPLARRHFLWESWLLGWCFGTAWYALNCYWIYRTMNVYGKLSVPVSAGILFGFSLGMGLYYALFGLLTGVLRKASRGVATPLLAAPLMWVGIDLLGQYLFRVPWDQLGYSQVGNSVLIRLAPWTGVHGITFVLLAVNAGLAAGVLLRGARARLPMLVASGVSIAIYAGGAIAPPPTPTQARAVLLQENLDVRRNDNWAGTVRDPKTGQARTEWDVTTQRFVDASEQTCTSFIQGMPEMGAAVVTPTCPPAAASLVVWPEAPAPFREYSPRFLALMRTLTAATHAPAIVGNVARDRGPHKIDLYNAASVFAPDGELVGRYSKNHLVPFGEYVPYKWLFGFVRGLTPNAGRFTHGWTRPVFTLQGRRYGVFICYESIFANEVRQFVKNGAEVLVNISDDGWYGDTSAPWQHLNMARMRAIENRRWLLRDANTGVTAAIDPWGRVTQSAPRHTFTSLAVQYGLRHDLTFYTRHGDVFAFGCAALSLGMVLLASIRLYTFRPHINQTAE
jgi:apolipoprotein N-acyltransferase